MKVKIEEELCMGNANGDHLCPRFFSRMKTSCSPEPFWTKCRKNTRTW
jgi:hypothetical protein